MAHRVGFGRRRFLLLAGACCVAPAPWAPVGAGAAEAAADSGLPRPTGEVLLTVSGAVARTNSPGGAEFDRAMLESLGTATTRTSTPYTEGVQEFRGVPLRRLLDAVGARGARATATALNDYRAELPLSDADLPGVLLATERNGVPMPVRDKGPLWLIYPLDSDPRLQRRETYAKMVWQLRRIEVR
jgi:hypothetical protein